jgi:hypothetical protein
MTPISEGKCSRSLAMRQWPEPEADFGDRVSSPSSCRGRDDRSGAVLRDCACDLGRRFLDDIRFAIDTIRERPKLGVEIAYGFRRVLVRRFPFSIIYFVEPEQIVVVAVAHQSRSPDYWKGRT